MPQKHEGTKFHQATKNTEYTPIPLENLRGLVSWWQNTSFQDRLKHSGFDNEIFC